MPRTRKTLTEETLLHQKWLQLAKTQARRSPHPTVKVGAVLTTPDGRVALARAMNAPPRGVALTPARLLHGEKSLWFMCAEKHALAAAHNKARQAGLASLAGCRIYSTLMPCHTCAHDIIQAGLTLVCVPARAEASYPRLKRKYRRSMQAASAMFEETDVSCMRLRWD
jgi:dCMP deaminase